MGTTRNNNGKETGAKTGTLENEGDMAAKAEVVAILSASLIVSKWVSHILYKKKMLGGRVMASCRRIVCSVHCCLLLKRIPPLSQSAV